MKAIQLLDTWKITGTDYKEFAAIVEDITQNTIIRQLETGRCFFWVSENS